MFLLDIPFYRTRQIIITSETRIDAILSCEAQLMPFLSDTSIRLRLDQTDANERIVIEPPPAKLQLGPCSIDLTLSTQFARFRRFPLL